MYKVLTTEEFIHRYGRKDNVMKIDIDTAVEAQKLVEMLEDAFSDVVEEFDADFTSRQHGDWVTQYGLSDHSVAEFSNVVDEIMFIALEEITSRWKEAGKLPK